VLRGDENDDHADEREAITDQPDDKIREESRVQPSL
jgi:hypothetical protein